MHEHLIEALDLRAKIALLTGVPVGVVDASGNYPAQSVYGRVMATLERFDAMLSARHI